MTCDSVLFTVHTHVPQIFSASAYVTYTWHYVEDCIIIRQEQRVSGIPESLAVYYGVSVHVRVRMQHRMQSV